MMVGKNDKTIPQIACLNGDESHGRIHKNSPPKQTKTSTGEIIPWYICIGFHKQKTTIPST